MGLERNYLLLKLISKFDFIDVTQAQIEMNRRYALWDDPREGGRTETCRACFKELWRLGFIDKVSLKNIKGTPGLSKWIGGESSSKLTLKIIPLRKDTWKGKQDEAFRISEFGKLVLEKEEGLFPYYVAWSIINAYKNGIYPQIDKLFKLHDKLGFIPVSHESIAEISKQNDLYVDSHGAKAINFGYLEPTGLIYRSRSNTFSLNSEYVEILSEMEYQDIYSDVFIKTLSLNDVTITLLNEDLGITDYSNGSEYIIEIRLKNNSNSSKKIALIPILYELFSKVSNLEYIRNFYLKPKEEKTVSIKLISGIISLSDSLMSTNIGYVEFFIDKRSSKLLLPRIDILDDDHIWELELIEMFNQLGIKSFHLTGKSDRPDGVIDLSRMEEEPEFFLQYLRDIEREKMLMETTLGEYSGNKLIADTIKKNKRGLNKFQTHTMKVLKIAANGQIIAANRFSRNIKQTFERVKSEAGHIITLIDKENLLYFIEKNNQNRDTDKVIEIITSGEIISKDLIDHIF